jgi:hypothetical protein
MGEHTDDGIGAPGDNRFRGEHDAGSDFATKVGEPDASHGQDRFVCQGPQRTAYRMSSRFSAGSALVLDWNVIAVLVFGGHPFRVLIASSNLRVVCRK